MLVLQVWGALLVEWRLYELARVRVSESGNQPSRVPTWSASGEQLSKCHEMQASLCLRNMLGCGETMGAGGGIIWIQSEALA